MPRCRPCRCLYLSGIDPQLVLSAGAPQAFNHRTPRPTVRQTSSHKPGTSRRACIYSVIYLMLTGLRFNSVVFCVLAGFPFECVVRNLPPHIRLAPKPQPVSPLPSRRHLFIHPKVSQPRDVVRKEQEMNYRSFNAKHPKAKYVSLLTSLTSWIRGPSHALSSLLQHLMVRKNRRGHFESVAMARTLRRRGRGCWETLAPALN
jgi:hypothetical protein